MKNIQFNRFLATMLTLVMTSMLITPVLAAAKYDTTDKKTVSKTSNSGARAALLQSIKAQDGEDDFPTEELELMRAALLELIDSNEELSTILSPQCVEPVKGLERVKGSSLQDEDDQFAEMREQIKKLTSKELTSYRKALNPTKMRAKIAKARGTVKKHKNSFTYGAVITSDAPGLPGINSYCGAPVSTEAIIAADVIYFVAEGVRDAAQDGCNQVLVVLGAGGNGRAACLVTDAIYVAAHAVNQALHFCDDDYAASVGQASFERLGHMHDDLETVKSDVAGVKANDNTNYTNIIGNAATNTTTITTAVTSAQSAIIGKVDAGTVLISGKVDDGTKAIILNDNTNKEAIVTNDNNNKNTIVANDNTNRALLLADAKANKEFLLRTQIEADLSSTDGAAFVALFLTPSNICFPVLDDKGIAQSGNGQCGYLELARSIVAQTINNLAGTNKTQATSFLTSGDSYKTAGNYKMAYQNYRQAYKIALGISTK
jgi:hypothetical protein